METAERQTTLNNPLPSWNAGASKQAIVDFVARVTTEGSADYVPPAERIAVFDNDGTLWCEKPLVIQSDLVIKKLAAVAEADAALRAQQPWKAAYEKDFAWVGNAITKHYRGDDSDLNIIVRGLLTLSRDRVVEEVEAEAWAFINTAMHPTLGRLYRQCVYQPMLELLRYLDAHGFITYIVSGGGRDFMRGLAGELYGIPRQRVIGSTVGYQYEEDEHGHGVIMQGAELSMVNDGLGKPVQIWNVAGRRPIFAAGNSNGDLEMLRFAGGPALPAFCLMILHDDASREFDYIAGAEKALDESRSRGWPVVSMKQDWSLIFPN
jgi:phosphoglycolate phosphatase-like HAD superfamily hydrolase